MSEGKVEEKTVVKDYKVAPFIEKDASIAILKELMEKPEEYWDNVVTQDNLNGFRKTFFKKEEEKKDDDA